MNSYQIWGAIITVIGTFIGLYGSWLQGKDENRFKKIVEHSIQAQDNENVPYIVVMGFRFVQQSKTIVLTVKNIGKKSAENVDVVFTKDSMPVAFSANIISRFKEIHASVEQNINIDIFFGIRQILSLPNSDEHYKEELKDLIEKFQNGEKGLIANFKINYDHKGTQFNSDSYSIILSMVGNNIESNLIKNDK